jgi:hypothetical protein
VKALFFRKLIPNPPEEFNYQQCCHALNIQSLAKRRKLNDIKLVLQTFSNHVDTESFIHNFNISVPSRTVRNFELFIPSRAKTDLGKFSVFNRAITTTFVSTSIFLKITLISNRFSKMHQKNLTNV